MNIGVVLVTFNRLEMLKVSLDKYACQTKKPLYLIVVDNCSTDGTKGYLDEWKAVDEGFEKQVITMPCNSGGAGGFYEGMRAALNKNAEWIWLADDDAFPREDALAQMQKGYEQDHDSVVAYCGAVYDHNQIRPGHRNIITQTYGLHIMHAAPLSNYEKDGFDIDVLSYVGALINVDALKKVGLCKKDFFIYYDDQEHSLRLRKVGRIVCVPSCIIDHNQKFSDKFSVSWTQFYAIRNELIMYKQHFSFLDFGLRIIKRLTIDSIKALSINLKLAQIYWTACFDALIGKTGLHNKYRPGWTI